MSDTRWLGESLVVELHERALRVSGGAQGILSQSLLQSALARPAQRVAYGDRADLADLAAAYAYGIIKDHPFADGNKRTAVLITRAFLFRNGLGFDPDEEECLRVVLGVARGEVSEPELAEWIRASTRTLRP